MKKDIDLKKKNLNCKQCGSNEFVTKPNRYEIYQNIDGKLVLMESPFVNDEIKLFCRACSAELENAVNLISE